MPALSLLRILIFYCTFNQMVANTIVGGDLLHLPFHSRPSVSLSTAIASSWPPDSHPNLATALISHLKPDHPHTCNGERILHLALNGSSNPSCSRLPWLMGPNRHLKATNDAGSGLAYLPVLHKGAVQVALRGDANGARDISSVVLQIRFSCDSGVEVLCYYCLHSRA